MLLIYGDLYELLEKMRFDFVFLIFFIRIIIQDVVVSNIFQINCYYYLMVFLIYSFLGVYICQFIWLIGLECFYCYLCNDLVLQCLILVN